jgi:peptidyl-tRNA hydrolase, PTH1 family
MKLVVGLGNPGRKYRGTRHNIGFEVIAAVASTLGPLSTTGKFQSEVVSTRAGSENVLLLSPLTYMNLSGRAVREAFDFYKLELADLLVICDDLNLPFGKIRIRASGSAGGQNGLKDIIEKLGSEQFTRLRIGVGRPPGNMDPADWVLSRFRDDEMPELGVAVARAREATLLWIESGVSACMNRFNAEDDPDAAPKPRGRPSSEQGRQSGQRQSGESSGEKGGEGA